MGSQSAASAVVPPDGLIDVGTPFAKRLGFRHRHFEGYLWKIGNTIRIPLISSLRPGQGHFTRLIEAIWKEGYVVAVTAPAPRMEAILRHKGFRVTFEWSDELHEVVPVFVKEPPDGSRQVPLLPGSDRLGDHQEGRPYSARPSAAEEGRPDSGGREGSGGAGEHVHAAPRNLSRRGSRSSKTARRK